MSLFSARDFDNHEQVAFFCDESAGLKAIIAIHNTNRGPSLGGCRMWPYASEDEAIRDVLRLSRGMTYKCAVSNLDIGGGKSVIIGNPRTDKSEALLRAMGRSIDRLGGRYIAAEDSGTSVPDMKIMREETPFVAGILDKKTRDGGMRSGDPSPATAYGTFIGIRAAAKHKLQRDDLSGLRVAIQGVGNVGFRLAKLLQEAGAQLWVTDIYEDQVKRSVDELGATAVGSEEIYGLDVDVFAPCALGAVLNDKTIPQLHARIIAGAANNQLSEHRHGTELMERGILYAPDYVINAGGIIDVSYERGGTYDRDTTIKHIEGIYDTLMEIFERAKEDGLPTNLVADQVAEERFKHKAPAPVAGRAATAE
jgi:leucine dehydrogenase